MCDIQITETLNKNMLCLNYLL